MNYEERYTAALERAKERYSACSAPALLEYIFPELKVSEDEKIRKAILQFFESQDDNTTYSFVPKKDILTWLEKQGEQKPYGQRKECEDCQFNYAGECKGFCQMKRDEQNPADEDEPKFRPGDIVQYITDSTDRRKIEEIDTLCNMYHTDSSPIMFEVEDEWKVVVNAEDVEQESVDKVDFEKKELKKIESKALDPDKVIAWLVGNICDFEYYVKRFKQDFGL